MFWCQQCEVVKQKEQLDISLPATFDEGISPQDVVTGINTTQPKLSARPGTDRNVEAVKEQCSAREACPATPSTADGSQSQRSQSSMDEGTRQAEKARLRAMVKSFSIEAISGLECKVVRNSGVESASGNYVSAKLFMDRALKKMTVNDGCQKLMIPVDQIVEVFSFEELMEHAGWKLKVGKMLGEAERSKAVFVHHNTPDVAEPLVCLLVSDEAEVERFVASLKILRLYSQSKAYSL